MSSSSLAQLTVICITPLNSVFFLENLEYMHFILAFVLCSAPLQWKI